MSSSRNVLSAAILALLAAAPLPAAAGYGIGEPATEEQIRGWDIDIRPDGQGLPPGQGSVAEGEALYEEQCSACHGVFGYGEGRYPALVGSSPEEIRHELARGGRPEKTVGSYWPYASTLYDYIRRTMPFGNAQSLTPDQTYALVAYVLNLNGVVEADAVMNAETLPKVKMPNLPNFVDDPRPDVRNAACMRDCLPDVEQLKIASYAKKIDVTPESDQQALSE